MPKTFVFVLLFGLLSLGGVVLFLPDHALAGGHYTACEEIVAGQADNNCLSPREVCYEGLVPCGKEVVATRQCAADNTGPGSCYDQGEKKCAVGSLTKGILHCQLCHFFAMINGAINYLFVTIIPILAVFMFVVAGAMFFLGGAKPNLVNQAKDIMKNVGIGLVLIYGAFIFVGFFLTVLGATKLEPVKTVWQNGQIFQVNCPIQIPKSIIQ